MKTPITVVGGGLAGVEAAWQCARFGVPVELYEMRPATMTPAHRTGALAELVCSNSFKSMVDGTAPALLKEEMRRLGSLTLKAAAASRVPAGGALAVDRVRFAEEVTAALQKEAGVNVTRVEFEEWPPAPAVVATGPLTSEVMAEALADAVGRGNLYFFDALAPIVSAESVDMGKAFEASRYDKGDGAYVNCPLTATEYRAFTCALTAASTAPFRDFEKKLFFEGCVPVEELARRGEDTLRFGPMKPVGLKDPRTGRRPYAVLQLRPEDLSRGMFGLVGFQTRLKQREQRRVFRMIPALAEAEFFRYGAAHRNTYICSPTALDVTTELSSRRGVFVAGQLTGVEGYMESAATGIVAGINAARFARDEPLVYPPPETATGALLRYISTAPAATFAPMNVNFGLFLPAGGKGKRDRQRRVVARAREAFTKWLANVGEEF
ncbi:MAG: methylenetetrahydrofolate--tRNA-(uracil(54)-C(5))-methyltransferase (FADH(2)-oxidizing) TrmFO [bacterium]